MSRPLRFNQLPLELASKNLLPHAKAGEPVIVLQLHGIGNLTTYRMQGRTNRVFRFEWDRQLQCHTLRVPHSLWTMDGLALAREALDQRLMLPLIVNVETADMEARLLPSIGSNKPDTGLAASAKTAEDRLADETSSIPTFEAIKAHLPIRLTALAVKMDSSTEVLRELILKADSRIVLKSGGWVGLVEEPVGV